jgi:transposase
MLPSMKRSYSTDLTDAEWSCLEPHVPVPRERGRPRIHTTREILNAIFYVVRSGCPWRLLPRDFPPWETVYWWFGRWRIDATFERLNAALREVLRARLGRDPLLARASPTPSQQRRPGSAVNREDTTETRRFEAGKDTCWWIPRVCSSKPRCTARRCLTRTG